MLFNSLTPYGIELPKSDQLEEPRIMALVWREKIADRCQHLQFQPLLPLQAQGEGFEPPFKDFNREYVVAAQNNQLLLICYRRDERKISAAGIKEKVAEKVERIEQTEERKVRKSERESIADELRQKSLPHISPTPKRVLILIDLLHSRILIGSNSDTLVSHVRTLVRDHILPRYSMPAEKFSEDDTGFEYVAPRLLVETYCQGDARIHYEQWMRRGVQGLHLHDLACLEKEGAKSIVVTGQALDAPVITDALDDGYLPYQVGISVLNNDEDNVIADLTLDRFGVYSKVKVPDYRAIVKSHHEDEAEAAMADLQATMILTAGTVHDVNRAITVAFGDDLAAGQAVQVSEELAAAIVEAATA